MTIEYVADTIQDIYYSGRVKVDKRLDFDNFIQLARMAHGDVLRKLFREQDAYRKIIEYYGQHVDRRPFDLGEKDKRGRHVVKIMEDSELLKLPKGLGVFAVTVLNEDGEEDGNEYVRQVAGADWLLTGRDFETMKTFTPVGHKLEIKGAGDCAKKVEVLGIFSDEDMDIPTDVAFAVVSSVLGLVLGKGSGFPVDKTDNNNPNVGVINQRLTQTTTNEQ